MKGNRQMTTTNNDQYSTEMDQLCSSVRTFILNGDYESGLNLVYESLARYPDSPQPHNLLAIILEKTGKHRSAMKHFQAALALDPEYLPAKYNLDSYGIFLSRGDYAFDENDLVLGKSGDVEIIFDNRNIAHAVRKNRIEYDEHGIGHVIRK